MVQQLRNRVSNLFFNFQNKIDNSFISRSIKFLGKNKMINKFFIKFADRGIVI